MVESSREAAESDEAAQGLLTAIPILSIRLDETAKESFGLRTGGLGRLQSVVVF
jgi:hypothetical protein